MYRKIDTKYSLLDDKVFKIFMEDKEVAKIIIEILLNKEIKELDYVDTEKEVTGLGMERTIRYDVLCKDDEDKYYDVELQIAKQDDLMERFRIYQSLLDKYAIRKGEKEYIKVRETYIIFICDFDFFGDGLGEYNIVNYCIDNNKICDDKTNKKIINLKGKIITNPKVEELIKLFKEKVYNDRNEKIEKLGKRLIRIVNSDEFYRRYEVMQTKEIILINQGIEQGIKQGIKQGIERGIRYQIKSLSKFGICKEDIIETIKEDYNLTEEEIKKYFD